jgi:hemerythrin-like domain-containing protein
MTIFERLSEEHDEVKDLLSRLETANKESSIERKPLFDYLYDALLTHAKAEELVFYPRIADLALVDDDEKEQRLVAEAQEEHLVAERLLRELRAMEPGETQWDAKCTVLKENVEHHIKEEEGPLFRKAKRLMARDEAEELDRAFMHEKVALLVAA